MSDQGGLRPRRPLLAGLAVAVAVAVVSACAFVLTRGDDDNRTLNHPPNAARHWWRRRQHHRLGRDGRHGQHDRASDGATRPRARTTSPTGRHRSIPPPNGAVPAIARPSRRRRRPLIAGLAAAVVVAVVVAGASALIRGHQVTDSSSRPGTKNTPETGQSPSTARPADFPAAAPAPGVYVASSLRADGSILTDQWLASRQPTTHVDLALATVTVGRRAFEPAITDRSLVVNGTRVDATRSNPSRTTTRVALGKPARYVHLRYVVSGVALLSDSPPAPAGRALVLLNAVGADAEPDPQVVHVTGVRVLSLSCRTGDAAPVPCGTESGTSWTVDLTGSRRTTVFAQVDLPGLRKGVHRSAR